MSGKEVNIKLDGDIAPIKLEGNLTPAIEGLKTNLDAAPKGLQKIFTALFGKRYADMMYYQFTMAAQHKRMHNLS